jgi:ATP-dependent RNA helicase RhlE
MAGRDLVGIPQTGTGKTAAFALPILHYLAAHKRAAPRNGCRVLVLSPTRALASQIAESFRSPGAGLPLTIAVVFGGVPYGAQIKALARGLDILTRCCRRASRPGAHLASSNQTTSATGNQLWIGQASIG